MNKNIWILIMGFFLFQACLDDEGNYSYSDLLPIEIDSSNIKDSYRITQLGILEIDPGVKQGEDDSNIAYEWKIFQDGNMPNAETGKVVDDVIGKERKLNYKVTTPPGEYKLTFKATDKRNGVTEVILRPIKIESFAPEGLMVMHGDSDSTDVSILVNDRIVPDVEKDEVKHNIFSITNGHRAVGAPGKLGFAYSPSSVYVYTKGNQGGCRARSSDLLLQESYADMFSEPLAQTNINFQEYTKWGYVDVLVNNGKVHTASQATTIFTKFSLPAFGIEYYAEPFLGTNERGYYWGVFYDRIGKRFLYVDNNVSPQTFLEGSGPFQMNDVGKDMVYAEHGNNKYWYCVMREPEDATKYFVFVCDLTVGSWMNSQARAKYDVSACTDLKDAQAFAVGNRSELLYYATKTEVKQCHYTESPVKSNPRYALPAALAGYEITMLHLFKRSEHNNDGKLLYIGVYNSSTGDGKLLECPIVETSGEILTDGIKTYDGFKKITHMDYKPF